MLRVCVGIHFSSGFRLLEQTVSRLRATTPPSAALMILADTQEPSALLQLRNLRDIQQLLIDGVRGSAPAFNLLVQASDADSLIFLTSGTILSDNWLNNMLVALGNDGRTEIVLATGVQSNGQQYSPGYPPVFLVRRRAALALGQLDQNAGPPGIWMPAYCRRASETGIGVAHTITAAQFIYPNPQPIGTSFPPAVAVSNHWSVPTAQIPAASQTLRAVPPCEARVAGRTVLPVPSVQINSQCQPSVDSSASPPLVTCIMPTRDRPAYVRQAIQYFERQSYPERELIILDDGMQPLAGEVPLHPRIRYVRVAPGHSVGAKRNQGCELARGTIIAHWDDDDWYGPDRLRAQVEPLLRKVAEITALRETTFFYVESWEFWNCSPHEHQRLFVGDVHGGTLVFYRHVWERLARYPCVSLAEDAGFLRQALKSGARLLGISSQNLFLYLRHATNTWSLNANLFRNSSRWHRAAEPNLPPSDRVFYERRCILAREPCA